MRIAREQISQLRSLGRQIDALHRELGELVTAHRPKLLAEQGCGALTAAILIGHTAGNERFRSEASFAMQTGTAPIPCSSGKRTQHRLNRGGDRQLNHALHIIAVTRAQRDPATKEYLARKEAEGKTNKGALRCPQAPPRPPLPQAALRAARRPAAGRPTPNDQRARADRARTAADPAASASAARARPDHPGPGGLPDGLHQLERPITNPSGPFSGPLPFAVNPTADLGCRKSTRSPPITRSPATTDAFSAPLTPSTSYQRPMAPPIRTIPRHHQPGPETRE